MISWSSDKPTSMTSTRKGSTSDCTMTTFYDPPRSSVTLVTQLARQCEASTSMNCMIPQPFKQIIYIPNKQDWQQASCVDHRHLLPANRHTMMVVILSTHHDGGDIINTRMCMIDVLELFSLRTPKTVGISVMPLAYLQRASCTVSFRHIS